MISSTLTVKRFKLAFKCVFASGSVSKLKGLKNKTVFLKSMPTFIKIPNNVQTISSRLWYILISLKGHQILLLMAKKCTVLLKRNELTMVENFEIKTLLLGKCFSKTKIFNRAKNFLCTM